MFSAVPRERKKCEMNSDLRSEVTCSGTPCLENTWITKSCASWAEVIVSCVGMNKDCFDSQSTTTRIESYPVEGGSFSMKSMEIEFHGHSGAGSCLSNP